jgi:PleD family two-component response regulator
MRSHPFAHSTLYQDTGSSISASLLESISLFSRSTMTQYTYLYVQDRPEQECGMPSVLIKPEVMINTTPKVYIWLLDNNLIKLLVLEYTLASIEQNPFKTCTTNEVLYYLSPQDFATIVLVVYILEIDGFGLEELIRQHKHSRYTLIVGISAVSPLETYTFKGYELNAVDYVCTPPMTAVLRANYFTLPGSVSAMEESSSQGILRRSP